MKEDEIVSKVGELMETFDHVDRYEALARSLGRFLIVAGGSILAYILIRVMLVELLLFSLVGTSLAYLVSFICLAIPLVGVSYGIVLVRGKVNAVPSGEWKETLSQGFPGALELLSRIEWQKKLDEISDVKLAALLYGVAKLACYAMLIFFVVILFGGVASNYALGIGLVLAVSFVVALGVGGRELLSRYREAMSLGVLLSELRTFYNEFKGSEFEIKA